MAETGTSQAFPLRPVTIVVPFPPGGSTDVAARLLAERMGPALGEAGRPAGAATVMVENRPGAATIVGAEYVARAAPDGHTVLMSSGTTLTINPLLPDRLPYRPEDFAPVALITKLPFAFVVRQGLPTTIPDFVALAKSRPGQLNYGSNGPSSFNNITAAMLCEGLGIRMQEVTYRGDAPQLNDLMAGTLDVIIVGGSAGLAAHRSGKGQHHRLDRRAARARDAGNPDFLRTRSRHGVADLVRPPGACADSDSGDRAPQRRGGAGAAGAHAAGPPARGGAVHRGWNTGRLRRLPPRRGRSLAPDIAAARPDPGLMVGRALALRGRPVEHRRPTLQGTRRRRREPC